MSFTIIPFDQVIEIPTDAAVCPYCKAKLSARCEGWVEAGDGTTMADHLSVDCANEPDIESAEAMNWFMVVISVMYLGASGWEFLTKTGSRFLGVVYLSWFVSNLMLAVKR